MAEDYNNENKNFNEELASMGLENKDSKLDRIKFFLSNPKNLVGSLIFLVLTLIIIFNVFIKKSSNKKDIQKQNEEKSATITEVAKVPEPTIIKPADILTTVQTSRQTQDLDPIELPPLPNLDIDVLEKINSVKFQDKNIDENQIDIERLRKEKEAQKQSDVEGFTSDDIANLIDTPKIKKVRKINPDQPPTPILFTTGVESPMEKKSNKVVSDFIFVDSSINAENSEDLPTQGKRLPNLGNLVAQGRVIDAVLETAINSGIPGVIRAVISRNVYAEAGRNILIPKGTRLYGSYATSNISSGRLVVTWSRLLRPDGISVSINSFGADQFGRAGVQGNVNKKYAETITSALLLSSIPLVGTVVAQKATGGRVSSNTTSISGQTITTTTDPINKATVDFTQKLSDATSSIVQDLIDTTVIVTIDQGTRIKVLVNQDLELVSYKPLTALNTTITYSSQ